MWAKWIFADGQEMWRDLADINVTCHALLNCTFIDKTGNGFHFKNPGNSIPDDHSIMLSNNTRYHLWSGSTNTGIIFEVYADRGEDLKDPEVAEGSILAKRKFSRDGIETSWLPIKTNTAGEILKAMFGEKGFGFYLGSEPVHESDPAVADKAWNVHILGKDTGITCTFCKKSGKTPQPASQRANKD